MTPQQMFSLVKSELQEVEREFARQSESSVRTISEIGKYLQESGGKRIRPCLLLLCTKLTGEVSEAAIKLAAVVEFIHAATLVHDDIIDGADTRRGRSSVNRKWGNQITVLAGDWLYMQSFSIALQQRNFQILEILIDLTQRMVEGELIQLTFNGNRVTLVPRNYPSLSAVQAVLARYPAGGLVTVFYDPADAGHSVHSTTTNGSEWAYAIGGAALVGAGLLLLR